MPSTWLNACVPVLVDIILALCLFGPGLVQQHFPARNKNKSLQKLLSAQHLVAIHEVTDCHCEAVLHKCFLCDNLPEEPYKVKANTHINYGAQYLHTRGCCRSMHHEVGGTFFSPNSTVNRVIPRSEARRQCAHNEHRKWCFADRALTTRTRVDAEAKQSNASTLEDLSAVASSDRFFNALYQHFAQF